MRGDQTEQMLTLRKHLSVLIWAAATASVTLSAAEAAPAVKAPFIKHRGAAAAPSGASALCQTYDWACARASSAAATSASEIDTVTAINTWVNRSVRAINDDRQYGVEEHWALPTKTGGDCEDFVLLKKRELIASGIDPKRLLIATALDNNRNPHAVLVFRSEKGDLVLDNLTNRIRMWHETNYLFLLMQDPAQPARWVKVFASG